MSAAEVLALHERAARLRAEADEVSRDRDALVAATLDAGEVTGIELARDTGLSTQRIYDMANAHRRRYSSNHAPRKRG